MSSAAPRLHLPADRPSAQPIATATAELDRLRDLPKTTTLALAPFLVPLAEVARLLSRFVASLHRDRAAGRFGPEEIRLSGSVLFGVEELHDWIRCKCPSRREWLAIKAAGNGNRQPSRP